VICALLSITIFLSRLCNACGLWHANQLKKIREARKKNSVDNLLNPIKEGQKDKSQQVRNEFKHELVAFHYE
jgi:hypothetical protein